MAESVQAVPRGELPRSEVMQTPEEVTAMLRLKALGWGVRRIAGNWAAVTHDGSPIFGAGRVGGVSRTGSAADADWARGMGGGTLPPACRQR
jgi:hypothetical protein